MRTVLGSSPEARYRRQSRLRLILAWAVPLFCLAWLFLPLLVGWPPDRALQPLHWTSYLDPPTLAASWPGRQSAPTGPVAWGLALALLAAVYLGFLYALWQALAGWLGGRLPLALRLDGRLSLAAAVSLSGLLVGSHLAHVWLFAGGPDYFRYVGWLSWCLAGLAVLWHAWAWYRLALSRRLAAAQSGVALAPASLSGTGLVGRSNQTPRWRRPAAWPFALALILFNLFQLWQQADSLLDLARRDAERLCQRLATRLSSQPTRPELATWFAALATSWRDSPLAPVDVSWWQPGWQDDTFILQASTNLALVALRRPAPAAAFNAPPAALVIANGLGTAPEPTAPTAPAGNDPSAAAVAGPGRLVAADNVFFRSRFISQGGLLEYRRAYWRDGVLYGYVALRYLPERLLQPWYRSLIRTLLLLALAGYGWGVGAWLARSLSGYGKRRMIIKKN
ncbi:MAG: hypothetical protein A2087_13960 [Spirochaetes bacterium GWD1_61_31]|nr:MAG: hypothetical protein A2Y37_09405 [Spirochaetes bacterium GWB1_60_80]OHD42232.1 MAG: hypothetical protein A2087_13960 [Spirochaetes bacterium GWD1_61_31]OHD59056.1 MAG: hypothetical protein A2Y32_02365 [Spirochaetes bacterium GWF1_60_12]HAP44025.1 hypothetical protein [Spirochaetaceae bacterium]